MSRTDNFNRADSYPTGLGTPSDAGSAWSTLAGDWGVGSNQARSGSAAGSLAVLECSGADGPVQVKFYGPSDAGLAFRATDAINYCFVGVKPGEIKLQTVVAGSYTTVGPTYTYSHAAGDLIAAVMSGSAVSVTLNGVEIIVPQTITFNQSATKHGLWTYTDPTVRFDDFAFTESGGGGLLIPVAMHHYRQQGIS